MSRMPSVRALVTVLVTQDGARSGTCPAGFDRRAARATPACHFEPKHVSKRMEPEGDLSGESCNGRPTTWRVTTYVFWL